jgi:hypothetical protein
VHSFSFCVASADDDLHITLAWADPPQIEASGGGVPPLVNDLDLELVDPTGNVWRPNPRTAVWQDGSSVLAPPGQSSTGGPPDRTNPNWDPTGGDTAVDDEDFLDADRSNALENVFIEASTVVIPTGTWTASVIGRSVQGAVPRFYFAFPDWVDDSVDPADLITDTEQGYALVVSGDVATESGLVHFDGSTYRCGQTGHVIVRDCDVDPMSGPTVPLTTEAGDCDVFSLFGTAPVLSTPPFQVVDVERGQPTSCAASDGVVVAPDDSTIRVTYVDSSPTTRTSSATARVHCRNVSLNGVTIGDGCDSATANGVLNRNELATLAVEVTNPDLTAAEGLVATLHPANDTVAVTSGTVVLGSVPPAGTATATFTIVVDPAQACPATLRFRVDVAGSHGFKDRLWLDVPLDDCAIGGVGAWPPPAEVPAVDTPGASLAMRVEKAGPGSSDAALSWDRAGRADRYNIWRGSLASLREGSYSHALPVPPFPPNAFCNRPELDPGDDPLLVNQARLSGEASHVGDGLSNYYYLITAESECPSGLVSVDGPWGFGDRDRDGLADLDETRPAGLAADPSCVP